MKIKSKIVACLIVFSVIITNSMWLTKSFATENKKSTAIEVLLNQISYATFEAETYDSTMWFKFTAPQSKYYEFEVVNPYYDGQDFETYITVYNDIGTEVAFGGVDDFSERCVEYVNCNQGRTYYIDVSNYADKDYRLGVRVKEHIHRYLDENYIDKAYYFDDDTEAGTITKYCSDCNFEYVETIPKIKSVSLAKTKYTYDGKVKKPAINIKDIAGNAIDKKHYNVKYYDSGKKVGNYMVNIEFIGDYYGGWAYRYYKIVPKGTSISKLTAGSKSFTVKWKKQTTQTTGYQIKYSLKSNMSSSKTVTVKGNKNVSKTIKKLKAKKKYYVQIRTYKDVYGSKYYSDWSAKKSIKTK